MNPPSALHGAMNRDRKPFTYTPGGLDLSEIKSERMAARLMRNAMNQGVPEVPVQPIQSPPMPSTPILVPNFNCLPVQVFPTFNLPANPKSLLRTRSNPDNQKESSLQRVVPPSQILSNNKKVNDKTFDPPKPFSYSETNNNRPSSMHEYSTNFNNTNSVSNNQYGNDDFSLSLPEISYDAEYLTFPAQVTNDVGKNKLTVNQMVNDSAPLTSENVKTETPSKPAQESEKFEDAVSQQDIQREVKVVKKTVNKEQKTEEQNGDQNGDVEAEMTVKLPTKKSSAKTETKVEVSKKILPDGTVEEVKTTTTKTTIDGRTEIKTKTETRTLPKEDADEEIEEEVEEETEEQETDCAIVEEVDDNKHITEESSKDVKQVTKDKIEKVAENGNEGILRGEERSETTTTTTKKVVILQSDADDVKEKVEEQVEEEEFEEEEIEETEPVVVVIKKQVEKPNTPQPQIKQEEEEEEEEEIEEEVIEEKKVEEIENEEVLSEEVKNEKITKEEITGDQEEEEEEISSEPPATQQNIESSKDEEDFVEEEEEYEEAEETEVENVVKVVTETDLGEAVKLEAKDIPKTEEKEEIEESTQEINEEEVDTKEEIKKVEEKKIEVELEPEEPKEKEEVKITSEEPEIKAHIPLREPSVPLDKVEDIEIKPIGPAGLITKTHTEKTEIITRTSPIPGALSTQTEYNRIEKIETVNRTTKTLDSTYESSTIPSDTPVVKTYFPPNRDRVLSSPMSTRPYQSVYTPEPTGERRHSLLLDRLSVDRQMPSDIVYNNQNYEQQRQWSQEPQSEVVTVSNVKPSKITNQQWYQQSKDSVSYNESTYTPPAPSTQSWTQPQVQAQTQPTYRPQPTYAPQQQYQPPQTPQPQYQAPQPQYQPPQQQYQPPQPQYQPPQPQYQAPITPQPQYHAPLTPQPQYQPPSTPQPLYHQNFTETKQERTSNTFSSYTPKPSWVNNNVESVPTIKTPQPYQHSFGASEPLDTYQKTSQQFSSSYVPPPWEQEPSYTVDSPYYQPPSSTFTPTASTPSWKPPAPKNKFTKPPPTAYIPPAPNQSFVKPITEAESRRQLGRKTYYSEYERRYISVPDTTYIPTETKFQPQPDPSPQYYYDNNEPAESVEHQWRKELREFTEKSSQTQTQTQQTNVKPPWEVDSKIYTKTPEPYSSTPTWSQTLRPRSWRERSFESEFVGSQEWPKTNTLGRSRPLSTCSKNEPIQERTRGVSVDRYNPNYYQSPSSLEHPPVQSHTLNPAPHGNYHNPNVPAYHNRASNEIREQSVSYKQPRQSREQRATPVQSRSFKYLQWITGTED